MKTTVILLASLSCCLGVYAAPYNDYQPTRYEQQYRDEQSGYNQQNQQYSNGDENRAQTSYSNRPSSSRPYYAAPDESREGDRKSDIWEANPNEQRQPGYYRGQEVPSERSQQNYYYNQPSNAPRGNYYNQGQPMQNGYYYQGGNMMQPAPRTIQGNPYSGQPR